MGNVAGSSAAAFYRFGQRVWGQGGAICGASSVVKKKTKNMPLKPPVTFPMEDLIVDMRIIYYRKSSYLIA